MDIREAIHTRRSIRELTTEAVDRAALTEIIDAAIQAPSAMNLQPWAFFVVQDKTLLARISADAKAHLLKTVPPGPDSQHLLDTLADPGFDPLYGAPALIVIAAVSDGPWVMADCSLAAQNLMLTAHAAGLGTCWIGLAHGWLATAEGKAALGMPAAYAPIAPIIIGHPKALPPPVPRNAPETHWLG